MPRPSYGATAIIAYMYAVNVPLSVTVTALIGLVSLTIDILT